MWFLECKHQMLTDDVRKTDDGQPLTTIALYVQSAIRPGTACLSEILNRARYFLHNWYQLRRGHAVAVPGFDLRVGVDFVNGGRVDTYM